MNVSLSPRHTVHVNHVNAYTGEQTGYPECGGNRGTERYKDTAREVTCKACLKWLAAQAEAEAAHKDRVEASMMPATEAHDLGYVAPVDNRVEAVQPVADVELSNARDEIAQLRDQVRDARRLSVEYLGEVTRLCAARDELASLRDQVRGARRLSVGYIDEIHRLRAEREQHLSAMARLRCDDCGGEGGGGMSAFPDAYLYCERCNGTGIDTSKNKL